MVEKKSKTVKKASVKKTVAKKAPVKKASVKKTVAKKAPVKKVAAKKSSKATIANNKSKLHLTNLRKVKNI